MNPIIKVYSFGRSGTHWLMSLLKNRFYGSVSTGETIDENEFSFHGWEEGNKCPWVNLLGGHWHSPKPYMLNSGVYLIRDGRDVMVSQWLMGHSLNLEFTLADMINNVNEFDPNNPHPKNIRNATRWRWSTNQWLKTNVFVVKYEDLMKDKDKELDRIAESFNLKNDPMGKADMPVGFHPAKKPSVGKWKKYFTEEHIKLFEECVREADAL